MSEVMGIVSVAKGNSFPSTLGLLGLVDEHDRDVVPDRVTAAASLTDEAIGVFAERPVVGRAHEDLEELLVDRHRSRC